MNQNTISTDKIISASLLRLRMKSPFFATLALFARFIPTTSTPTAATDGKDIFFNPDFLLSLPSAQQDGLFLHEVLHAALLHVLRRGVRNPQLWNIAADIVVNGTISAQGCFELPANAIRDQKLEHLSVEEIYELLLQEEKCSHDLIMPDLLDNPPSGGEGDGSNNYQNLPDDVKNDNNQGEEDSNNQQSKGDDSQGKGKGQDSDGEDTQGKGQNSDGEDTQTKTTNNTDSLSEAKKAQLESHWQNALQQATVIARTTNQGNLPAGMARELGVLNQAQLDWRSYLWRYLVKTPTDFTNFDRRFVGRGLYLETLEGESVKVYVAIDTSGSIDNQQLKMFLSEVNGILNSYPHLECELYYADADVYGPYEVDANSDIPQPEGGGGTSFIPFFDRVSNSWDGMTTGVCVYLTDGYGSFPDTLPELPVLWVVTPGGLDLSQFPFGEAVRLLSI